jgi:hypothetical protein
MTVIPGSIRRRKAHVAATGLASLAFAVSGAADLVGTPAIMASLAHLGYPAYAATILGFWKVLGAAAIATPFAPRRLKEWAYAGMFFDLTGAAASHAALGDAVGTMLAPLGLLAVVMASWALQERVSPYRGEWAGVAEVSTRTLVTRRPSTAMTVR